MCQIDETFIAILNKMRTNNQTYDELTYINLRCLRPSPTDPMFRYLFYINKYVAKHNNHMTALLGARSLSLRTFSSLRPEELQGSSDPLSGILHTHSNSRLRPSLLPFGGSTLAPSRIQQLSATPSDPRDPTRQSTR
jgi:hypothetical protein